MPEPGTLMGIGAGILVVMAYLAKRFFTAAKEVVDILLAIVALILTLPLMLVCAVIIKLSSPGPIFFKQVRLGRHGKRFNMFKFRTMFADAESALGAVWAEAGDSRVVPWCRWMRRCHADELPQLINVIKGEMSIIGPRPERPEIYDDLEKAYPNVRRRLAVKPGITGLAQVRTGYDTSIEEFRKKLAADLEYIEKRNWRMELLILARTLGKLNDSKAH